MRFRKLGRTDLDVSVVSLGTWVFGGDCWGEADDASSIKAVREAIDGGINMIDTAPVYGSGRSESIVGRAIEGRRDEVVIATKCGLKIEGSSIITDLSADFIREEIEASLRRLGVETIDLYQCHWPDRDTPVEETFGEMMKLVAEGKIRYIGVSNFDTALLSKALEVAPVASNQVQYSLLDRSIEEELVPFCGDNGVSVLSYGSLGGGILTGKYKELPKLSKSDVRSFFYKFYKEPMWAKNKRLVGVLEDIAKTREVPVAEVAINWVLGHEVVASSITGCRNPEQVRKNLPAGEWVLEDGEMERIDREWDEIFKQSE